MEGAPWGSRFVLAGLVALGIALWALPARAADVQMTFYGNQAFRFVSPNGRVVWVNPWITGNADAPIKVEEIDRADLILVTDGHSKAVGDTVEIAKRTKARIVAISELANWLWIQGVQPEQIQAMGIGGIVRVDGLLIRAVGAVSGSGYSQGQNQPWGYGGAAAGYIITFENGLVVYFSGGSALTVDMQLYGVRYKPHVALLSIGGRFSMHPDDAAFAAQLLMTDNPNLHTVVPQQYTVRQPSAGGGTPEQFEAEVRALKLPLRVLNPRIGQSIPLPRERS